MTDTRDAIPFSVDISRMIELLASQMYPSPFALLRENVQNAFDAVMLRRHAGQTFDAKIEVTIEPHRIVVSDNGIGMSRQELRDHFWRAGSSSKNTDEARAAGVVGTFGIRGDGELRDRRPAGGCQRKRSYSGAHALRGGTSDPLRDGRLHRFYQGAGDRLAW